MVLGTGQDPLTALAGHGASNNLGVWTRHGSATMSPQAKIT